MTKPLHTTGGAPLPRTAARVMELLRCGMGAGVPDAALFAGADAAAWREVVGLAARQGVAAIACDALKSLPAACRPPREVLFRWAADADRTERDYAHKRETLGELAAFYARHGIRTMVLKGYGLSLHYPVPEHRPCGDIDIWLYGRQPEADARVREELGIDVRADVHHHTVFTFRGVTVENHFDFLNLWAHRSNRELERLLRRYAAQEGEEATAGAGRVALPSPDLNALFLMRHMAVHFAAVEIGLRHLSDWAVFLAADGRRVNWQELRAVYREHNMLRFADAVTGLCVRYLGVDPDVCPYEEDPELQRVVLREILSPAFAERHPTGGVLKPMLFKVRRWWANRWKHRLVYKDTLAGSFVWLCWAHVIRPKTMVR
ncbi:nucleotidyltransferase family protein [uncultured Alistipes sp.]|jgi:hypothetical protein|uniref:nucleotidyltransferase domain-containing protein n=1 Tax=uncultured Alistipes sp. TaxID=538949 RepID=UPI002621A0FE|nr:nucleotidyltransferase family protein [uncultured Alistipes sp.]